MSIRILFPHWRTEKLAGERRQLALPLSSPLLLALATPCPRQHRVRHLPSQALAAAQTGKTRAGGLRSGGLQQPQEDLGQPVGVRHRPKRRTNEIGQRQEARRETNHRQPRASLLAGLSPTPRIHHRGRVLTGAHARAEDQGQK